MALLIMGAGPAWSDDEVFRPSSFPTSEAEDTPWMPDVEVESSGVAHKWGTKKDKRYLKIHATAADIRRAHGMVATTDSTRVVQIAGGASSTDAGTVKVDEPEGGHVVVDVANPIKFRFRCHAQNGDTHILVGEGVAYDVKTGEHKVRIDLNLVKESETTNESEESNEIKAGTSSEAGATASTSGASLGGRVTSSVEASSQWGYRQSYKHGSTISFQMAEEQAQDLLITDHDEGTVPYERTWTWSSRFTCRIGTKAVQSGTPQEAETVLEKFTIINDAGFVWVVYTSPPPSGTPTGSGADILGCSPIPPGSDPYAVLADETAVTASVLNPRGIQSEAGAGEGLLMVQQDRTVSEDRVFSVATVPSDVTDLPAQMTIEAGEVSALESFQVLNTGSYTIRLTLLDGSGVPTSTVLDVAASGTSLSSHSAPKVHLRLDSPYVNPSSTADEVVFPQGTAGIALVAERTGFADYASASTTVDLDVSDPNGILSGVPTSLVIPAGSASATASFDVTSASGEATITGSYGTTSEWVLKVKTGSQAIVLPRTAVTLPANATCWFPVGLALREDEERTVTVTSGTPSVVGVLSGRDSLDYPPAMGMRLAGVTASAQGSSTLYFASTGLTTQSLDVTVVAAEVAAGRTGVTLTGVPSTDGGPIHVRLAAGGTFATVTPPTGSGDYLAVSGVGTDVLTLTFAEGEERPSSLTVSYTLADVPGGAFPVEVWDNLHPRWFGYYTTVD